MSFKCADCKSIFKFYKIRCSSYTTKEIIYGFVIALSAIIAHLFIDCLIFCLDFFYPEIPQFGHAAKFISNFRLKFRNVELTKINKIQISEETFDIKCRAEM